MPDIDAKRALALVGAGFLPQGRDPDRGLDCVGVAICALGLPASAFRNDYRLRGAHRSELIRGAANALRRIANRQARPGDLQLFQVSADQVHAAILSKDGLVHADAGIGKVVHRPGPAPWPIIATFRRRVRQRK